LNVTLKSKTAIFRQPICDTVYARCSWAVYPKKEMFENLIYLEEKMLIRVEEISTHFIRQLEGTVQAFE